jgi:predicted DNA-binding transcriptional regulator AlpA
MTTLIQLTEQDLDSLVIRCTTRVINQSKENTLPQDDRIGIDDAIEMTGLTRKTIYKMSCYGEIPCMKYGNRRLVFSRKELIEWIAARTIKKMPAGEIMANRLSKG